MSLEPAHTGRKYIPPTMEAYEGALQLSEMLRRLAVTATRILKFKSVVVNLQQRDGHYTVVAYADRGTEDLIGGTSTPEVWEALLLPQYKVSNSYLIPPEHTRAVMGTTDGAGWAVSASETSLAPDAWDPMHALIVPLLDHNGDMIGFFAVDDPEDRKLPSHEDIVDLETLAQHAALAIENFHMYHDLVGYATKLGAMQAIGSRLSRINDLEAIGRAIAEGLWGLVEYDRCRVHSVQDGRLVPITLHGARQEYTQEKRADYTLGVGEGLTGWAALHGEALIVDDAAGDPRAQHVAGTDYEDESMLVVPMTYEEQTLGVISLAKLGLKQFSPNDLRMVRILADHAATAIQNARLLERVRDEVEAEALRQSEARFRSLVQNASDIIAVVTPDGLLEYVSPAVRRVLGVAPEYLSGADIVSLVHPEDRASAARFMEEVAAGDSGSVELRMGHPNRSWRYLEVTGHNALGEESVGGIVLNCRDVTERKAFERELRHQAFHDPLTGLPNRARFMQELEQALYNCAQERCNCALLFLDLDGFKAVNDTLGHKAGDALLVAVAGRLSGCLRPDDTVARLGGDEFTILLRNMERAEEAEQVAGRVLAALSRPFNLDGRTARIGSSVGIAVTEASRPTADEWLRNADTAMYHSKRSGKGRYTVFSPELPALSEDELAAITAAPALR